MLKSYAQESQHWSCPLLLLSSPFSSLLLLIVFEPSNCNSVSDYRAHNAFLLQQRVRLLSSQCVPITTAYPITELTMHSQACTHTLAHTHIIIGYTRTTCIQKVHTRAHTNTYVQRVFKMYKLVHTHTCTLTHAYTHVCTLVRSLHSYIHAHVHHRASNGVSSSSCRRCR